MAEQKAVAAFLVQDKEVIKYLSAFRIEIEYRLRTIYDAFQELKKEGFSVDAIAPQAAIYLTVQIDLAGKSIEGKTLRTQGDVTDFILNEAKLALVPFNCFGAKENNSWYRLSVGCCNLDFHDF